MGYSKNPITVARMLPQLEGVLRGEYVTWTVAEGTADLFAYKIRECFSIAELYPDKFPMLSQMAASCKVVVTGVTTVTLKPRNPADVKSPSRPMNVTQGPADPTHNVATQLSGMTAVQVIGEWQKIQPSNDKLSFPKAHLTHEEATKLYKFLTTKEPRWIMFIGVDGQLTIQPHEAMWDDLHWTPEDEV